MNEPPLAVRDVRMIALMRSGWQFGFEKTDYFAEKDNHRVYAQSLDEVVNMLAKPNRPLKLSASA
jgi:hypothetical protein